MSIDPRQPLVVMYHYVWPDARAPHAGVRPLRTSQFEAQLDRLSTRYDIVDANTFLARMGQTSDRPPCLLTFDDGTRDHAEVVTPILSRRGLSGVFFILSDAARGRLMPTTHLVHWLLGEDDEAVWQRLLLYANDHNVSPGDPTAAAQVYHYESATRGRIKYALNMALPATAARGFALAMLAERGGDEHSLAREWFAQPDDLRAMHAAGMTLALHGRTHESLQRLRRAIAEEIADCSAFLRSLTAERPTWWACPFGGSGASADDHAAMQAALRTHGIQAAVSTLSASVSPGCDRLALPRVDCMA